MLFSWLPITTAVSWVLHKTKPHWPVLVMVPDLFWGWPGWPPPPVSKAWKLGCHLERTPHQTPVRPKPFSSVLTAEKQKLLPSWANPGAGGLFYTPAWLTTLRQRICYVWETVRLNCGAVGSQISSMLAQKHWHCERSSKKGQIHYINFYFGWKYIRSQHKKKNVSPGVSILVAFMGKADHRCLAFQEYFWIC